MTAFATCSKPAEIDQAMRLFPPDRYDLRCFTHPQRSGLAAKVESVRRPYSYMFSPEMRGSLERADRSLINVHFLPSIDLQEVKSADWRQSITNRLAFRTERRFLAEFHHLRACSSRIAEVVRVSNPGASVATVPFGIDSSGYAFIPDNARSAAPVIGLIGSMGWYPGYSAAVRLLTRLYPEIKRRVPDVTVRIAGWSARSALRDFLDLPGVEILENLADVRPFFES